MTSWLPAVAQVNFQLLNTGDGLSHSTVHDLLQDRKGFLWLATADGLDRYDGQSFQVYRRSQRDPGSLSSNEVTCLFEDKQGRLWVGTRSGGLSQLDSTGIHFDHLVRTSTGVDMSTATITALEQDRSGKIWATTNDLGILQINPATREVKQLSVDNYHLPKTRPFTVCPDHDGNIWIGYEAGVVVKIRLSDYQVRMYQLPIRNTVSTGNIMTLLCDSRGQLLAGTQGWGLFRYNPAQESFSSIYYREGTIEGVNFARSLYEDATGKYWLGTDDGVLVSAQADFGQPTQYRAEPTVRNSLSTHAILCVRGDKQGNIWMGTWEGGLNVLFAHPGLFEQYTHQIGQPNSLMTPQISSVSADKQGNVWMGSTQGLTYLNRKANTYHHYKHRPGDPTSLAGNDVTFINSLSNRVLLVSIWNKGTDVVDTETGRVLRHLTQLNSEQIHTVLPTDSHKAWVATNRGTLWELDTKTWQIEPVKGFTRTNNSFRTILEGSDGTLWIGTLGRGLIEWRRRTGLIRRHRFSLPDGLDDSHVTCLLEDRQHRLWVGTLGGLHRFNTSRQRFELISTDNGLSNDAIMSLCQDRRGNVWVATNDGLCQLNEAGQVVRTYRKSDGLPGNDFTEKAVSQSPDGTLFWGGKYGLTVFNPVRFETNAQPFPVYITGMKLFNRAVVPGEADSPLTRNLPETKSITLQHDQTVMTFEFATVAFQAHRNIRYAYRLDGFEKAWNFVGPQQSATYTNLDPGTYLFRVKAATSDDFAKASETVLQLIVLPPWYRTYWAYFLYAGLVASLLMLIRRMIQIRESYKTELRIEHIETEKARELDRLRSGFFTNISHEFRTPLTLIMTPLEQFLSDRAPDPRRLWFQTMHQNAHRLLRLINQLLDLSKLESGSFRPEINRQDILEFVRRVVGSFEPIAVQQRVTLQVETELATFPAFFDPDIVEKILYNLIANALKFTTEGGTVTIRCAVGNVGESPELLLEVEDTGIGISADHVLHIFDRFYQVNGQHQLKKAGTGIGLALTRELVELHRGSIQVESQLGVGTVFTINLPVSEISFPVDWLSNRPVDGVPIADKPAIWLETASEVTPSSVNNSSDLPLVLIVEDHDDLRHYLSDCFSQSYRVLQATNGREALEQAEKEVPDLIVSDWLMPDMDGVQLCEAIKTNEKTSHVPLILLTSKSSTESKLQGLSVGADDYVTKPFNVDLLRTRARNLIQSRQQLREKYGRMIYLQPFDLPIESAEELFLKKVLSLIETHIADTDLDVQRLERELGMSNTQLYRKLRALTGKGGNELIRSIRLERARQWLRAGGHQVAEVAYLVGFNDPNYFIRAFRKEFGVPPGEYLQESKSNPDKGDVVKV
ncbi:response regulator [Spirosoma aureum]|uniref:histidine kinase n=1 Tax=Spirosoma aureum TaxID=2692134 RepID=A0A6G9AY26_9BACT|nr:hybrid sensor histidine kinase/response regulator transcription factor [Spirosoma aureum]QIP17320.1 response regulator [Spirosoma aureum]